MYPPARSPLAGNVLGAILATQFCGRACPLSAFRSRARRTHTYVRVRTGANEPLRVNGEFVEEVAGSVNRENVQDRERERGCQSGVSRTT